ncbi:ABC transporter ATP-binding protein [Egibacter rhizosphaerae]|uniref:ABC transporter ATP-binding protein n=1 Tax=Egibacter rhizosphaerae TaxID=1670831 RepID=UPI00197AFBA9|nr:oligopeptide/dipeptide ABC transporter ATP-binding protein [Egibacter rhizosphaerae]
MNAAPATSIVAAEGVARHYRLARTSLFGPRRHLTALRGVDLAVPPGDRVGVVGESGSGKSTLARILLGLERPDEGRVTYGGQDLARAAERDLAGLRRDVQIVFQDPMGSLDPRLTVADIVREPLRALRIETDHDARLAELLDAVRLGPEAASRYPHEFSGGQRQRIAIARALAPRPRVLVADEPVSALDVSVRAQILNLLADLRDAYDLALVLISHDLAVVRHVCDRVLVMHLGEVVEEGPTERLFTDPQHPYTRALLQAIPTIGGGLPAAPLAADDPPSPTELPVGCAYASRCPHVFDRCHAERPPLAGPSERDAGIDTAAQRAACHLAFSGALPPFDRQAAAAGRHATAPEGRPATAPEGRPATPPEGRPATPPEGAPATPPEGGPATPPEQDR